MTSASVLRRPPVVTRRSTLRGGWAAAAVITASGARISREQAGPNTARAPSTASTASRGFQPTASLAGNPSVIRRRQSTTLSWNSTTATSCSGGGFSTGGAPKGSASVTPRNNTVYSVSCSGAGGTASATASITVNK